MAFSVPVMPIECDIYTGPYPTRVFRATVPCNLAVGRRMPQPGLGLIEETGEGHGVMTLLVPAGTDLRDYSAGPPYVMDLVEVPRTTGRWYVVLGVDDYGKGFPNEHRFAWLAKAWDNGNPLFAGIVWPTPIP